MKKLVTSLFIVLMLCGVALATDERFPVQGVEVLSSAGVNLVQGDITNNSGRRFTVATLTLSFYDAGDNLLGTAPIFVQNFAAGSTVHFNVTSERSLSGWATHSIRLDSGM